MRVGNYKKAVTYAAKIKGAVYAFLGVFLFLGFLLGEGFGFQRFLASVLPSCSVLLHPGAPSGKLFLHVALCVFIPLHPLFGFFFSRPQVNRHRVPVVKPQNKG